MESNVDWNRRRKTPEIDVGEVNLRAPVVCSALPFLLQHKASPEAAGTPWEGDTNDTHPNPGVDVLLLPALHSLWYPPEAVRAHAVSQNKRHTVRVVSKQFVAHRLGSAGVGGTFRSPLHAWEPMDKSTTLPVEVFSRKITEWKGLGWKRT